MQYPGGKQGHGVYQRLINQIPPHATYIAAFAGCDAIARHKRPAERTILVDRNVESLRKFAMWIGKTPHRIRSDWELVGGCGIAWLTQHFGLNRVLVEYAHQRWPRKVDAEIGDGGHDATFVYLDPPYLLETRGSSARPGKRLYGEYELSDQQHGELIWVAKALPCPVMVSHYPCRQYCAAFAEWRQITYRRFTHGGPREESAWMNYPRPTRLHDSRYVGESKRQRERIKRRVRNWTAALSRCDPLERQAIEDAIFAAAGDGRGGDGR